MKRYIITVDHIHYLKSDDLTIAVRLAENIGGFVYKSLFGEMSLIFSYKDEE